MRFPIIICTFFLLAADVVVAKDTALDELNSFLVEKNREIDPYDPKKNKIDVESLGLDDVNSKQLEKENRQRAVVKNSAPPVEKTAGEKVDDAIISAKKTIRASEKKVEEIANEENAKSLVDKAAEISKKVSEKLISVFHEEKTVANPGVTQQKQSKETASEAQKSKSKKVGQSKKKSSKKYAKEGKTESYLNSKRKQKLKQRIESEQRKVEQEKMKEKLAELREAYLQTEIKTSPSGALFGESYEKIVPREKNLSRFDVEESPPPPLMSYDRSQDNRHIPLFLRAEDYANMLFEGITTDMDVSFFNEVYKHVKNPNLTNKFGDTLLTCALLMRRYAVVSSILAKGADPDLSNNFGYTPLDIAIEMQDARAVEILLENKASHDLPDAFGSTYLIHATRIGFLPSVQLLIDSGADVNAMDNEGFTALSVAYRYRREVIVRYLLDNGAKTWLEQPFDTPKSNMIQELEKHWQ